jgi:hypothetical protein
LPSQFTRYPTAALFLPVVLLFKHTSSPEELADSYLEYLFFSLGFFDSSGNLAVGCKLFVLVGLTRSQKLRIDATADGFASQQPTRMGIGYCHGGSSNKQSPAVLV